MAHSSPGPLSPSAPSLASCPSALPSLSPTATSPCCCRTCEAPQGATLGANTPVLCCQAPSGHHRTLGGCWCRCAAAGALLWQLLQGLRPQMRWPLSACTGVEFTPRTLHPASILSQSQSHNATLPWWCVGVVVWGRVPTRHACRMALRTVVCAGPPASRTPSCFSPPST